MATAQNDPGITNFVTPIKTACWNHTPLLLVTPQAANKTIEQGGFQGDTRLVAAQILRKPDAKAGDADREERRELIKKTKADRVVKLAAMDHDDDDPGTTWNQRSLDRHPDHLSPRQAWRAIMLAMPENAIISSDIGYNCAIGNAYPSFEHG